MSTDGNGGESGSGGDYPGGMTSSGRSMLGRFVNKAVSSSNYNGDKSASSSLHGNSSHQYTCHPALEEGAGSIKSSKALFQKEGLMDLNIVKKVFEGGERSLRAMQASAKAETMEQDGSSTINGGVENAKGHSSRRRSSATKTGPLPSTGEEVVKSVEVLDREAIEKIDIYGSAFLMLLYMSESRWDYVTEIAKLSAKKAGLTTDVNKLALLEAENDQMCTSKSRMNGVKSSNHKQHKEAPPRLSPPSFAPPSATYNKPDLICNEPGGIKFTSLCYIIAMALRGSRRQKLNLLFYLLLPPKELDVILASHAAGGLPTWLLEMDGDVVLTYSSLSYYYHYEGVMLPLAGKSGHNFSYCKNKQLLSIDAKGAVEVLATLLAESTVGSSLQSSFNSGNGENEEKGKPRERCSYGTRRLTQLTTASDSDNEDDFATQPIKCHNVIELLNATLDGEQSTSLSPKEMERIKSFLHASSNTMHTSSSHTSTRSKWSMKQFVQWADLAMDDLLLDSIMKRLFGSGILPSAKMECELVTQRWVDWNLQDVDESETHETGEASSPVKSGFRSMFGATQRSEHDNGEAIYDSVNSYNQVWGGIGGVDGKGGLGYGVLYCIDKQWWENWVSYTGWQFGRNSVRNPSSFKRPRELSTERLIDRSHDAIFVAGIHGSYELMSPNLSLGVDYVLVPPGVWNVLYELYGGGPPLPRMVLPSESSDITTYGAVDRVVTVEDDSVEIVPSASHGALIRDKLYPTEIPKSVRVATHPWILHCQICDPQQPYRRGDAGPISIRIMAMPDQPLWRFFSELVVRLPIVHSKARDSHGEGRARLWRFEVPNGKNANTTCRYGPWALLCKNRFAEIPINVPVSEKFEERWQSYADKHSVESIGLVDGSRLMFEYAVVNKDGSFLWPREAAAKATRIRRIADEDAAFRLILRGLDSEGKPLCSPIIRTLVDAMDTSGRWYQAVIVNVDNSTRSPDDGNGTGHSDATSDDAGESEFRENTYVRVHFNDHAGNHKEWIDVKSDRLAVGGRFTADSVQNLESDVEGEDASSNDLRSRISVVKKKDAAESTSSDANSNSLCLFPSYGACGLINLGNTCYANSGIQCLSYLPLLRSYLLSGQFKGDLNRDNPLGTGGKLLEEFAELMQVMWSGKYGVRAPQKFRSFLGKCRPQYSGADQQDAQELINDMIDMLHEDGNRVKKKPYVEALEDKFIEKTDLPKVGQEAWRRFLRRNRSAVSDLSMGQVYNSVTCPVCNHSSKNFDPFNMLSLPFPTVAEVIFQCTVVRRATVSNCPSTLLMVGTSRHHQMEKMTAVPAASSPPSTDLIFEQYAIPMSRLADIGDLKMKLQNISGIPANHFRVCKRDDVLTGMGDGESSATTIYTKVTALPDKEGPCINLLRQAPLDDATSPMIAKIIAFEMSLSVRPPVKAAVGNALTSDKPKDDASTADEMSDDSSTSTSANGKSNAQDKMLEQTAYATLKIYGDEQECIAYDTNPTSLSKFVSRSLWPKSTKDFTLGLRVDAIDHRNHWFPGSVIEIIEGTDGSSPDGEEEKESSPTKVKVHFDNFSGEGCFCIGQ